MSATKYGEQQSHHHHQSSNTENQDTDNDPAQQKETAVLKHGRSTCASDISEAITTKHNQIFLLTTKTGEISGANSGLGLYYHDTRFLDHYTLWMNGQQLTSLLANAERGDTGVYELTNPDLPLANNVTLPKERLSVEREQKIGDVTVTDTLTIRNLAQHDIELELTMELGSEFTNMFVVRGAQPGQRGTLHDPQAHRGAVVLKYDGADGHRRTTTAHFHPAPSDLHDGTVTWQLKLDGRKSQRLTTTLTLADTPTGDAATQETDQQTATEASNERGGRQQTHDQRHGAQRTLGGAGQRQLADAFTNLPKIETANPLFNRALARSFADLRMLVTGIDDTDYIAAGVPWYVALFGRDSIIASYETLAFQPPVARATLRLLARYQGTEHNDFQDEEPGKILHELRVGEKANLHEVPQIPYYGSVDSTPWFLMLLGEYVRCTGDIGLFKELHDNVHRALGWIDENLRGRIEGFLSYGSRSEKGLINQGWKDSGNSIVNTDGSLVAPPIALVEVQGYVYAAWRAVAALYRQTGDKRRATTLDERADDLQKRFHAAYWMADAKFFALALERDRKAARAIASNPGQALFSRIVDAEKAPLVADRLLADDMFSGWGVRSLSADETAYNPLDYQVGSIWPHDNALIALGLRRYGLTEQMERIFTGIFQAATHFPMYRLPEVFDGFGSHRFDRPVHYPVACSPQAWAAGSLPLLLTTALGLEPDAINHQLRIHCPRLPQWLADVTARGLRIGDATVDLRYQRSGDTTLVAVLKREGDLGVTVEY